MICVQAERNVKYRVMQGGIWSGVVVRRAVVRGVGVRVSRVYREGEKENISRGFQLQVVRVIRGSYEWFVVASRKKERASMR